MDRRKFIKRVSIIGGAAVAPKVVLSKPTGDGLNPEFVKGFRKGYRDFEDARRIAIGRHKKLALEGKEGRERVECIAANNIFKE